MMLSYVPISLFHLLSFVDKILQLVFDFFQSSFHDFQLKGEAC